MATSHIKYVNIFMNLLIYVPSMLLIYYFGIKFYRYIWPKPPSTPLPEDKRSLHLWARFKHFLLWILGKVFPILIDIKDFIVNNYFRLGALIFFIIYLGISYTYTVGGFKNKTEGNLLIASNIGWVLLGIYLAFNVFNLFLKSVHIKNKYPENASFKDKAKWTFWRSFFDFKVIIGITLLLALVLLVVFLLARYSLVTQSLAALVQVFAVLGLLFLAYRWLNQHPKVKRALEDNLILKILYHLIFLIPCFIITSAEHMYKDLKSTPRVVWTVLAIEMALIFVYFIAPVITKAFFTTNLLNRRDELTVPQAMDGIDASIYTDQQAIKKIKKGMDVDWKNILKLGLYKKDQDDVLTDYLHAHGFTDIKTSQNKIKTLFFGIPPTFEAAKSYIQANGPILFEKESSLANLIQERDTLEPEMKKAFDTKQLLNKAVFTDIQRVLGNFEDLLSGIQTYNYQYGLSAWIFIHEQPPNERFANNQFTSIINYGDRPNILFNVSENKLQIRMKNSLNEDVVVYETDKFALQKWNNLVINYDGGTLDLFINGKLVVSKPNLVPYMSYSTITVGEEKGVSGGACNIVYFSNPLSRKQIEFFYNTLKNRNPPMV